MSGVNRTIFVPDLALFDPEDPSVHVGDWVAEEDGAGPLPQQVVRLGVGQPKVLFGYDSGPSFSVLPAPSFTPGGAGSFAGTIRADVVTRTGAPMADELVDVDIILAANVVSLGIAGGHGVLSSLLTQTTSARVRAVTDVAGRLDLALVGTSATAYRITITVVRAAALANQSDAFQILTGNLP